MKTRNLFGAALLGLALSSPAFAQMTVPATGGVPNAAGIPPTTPAGGAIVPGQPNTTTGTLPSGGIVTPGASVPLGTSPAGVPATGTIGSGTLRGDQPAGVTTPATRSAQRNRRGTTTPNTTPVRP